MVTISELQEMSRRGHLEKVIESSLASYNLPTWPGMTQEQSARSIARIAAEAVVRDER